MLFFYHSQQQPENMSFFKGKLFEELLKTFLGRLGYDVTLREKHNSLEYDIHGRSRLTGASIVGEAKAHAKTISGHDFSSFVGKLLPLRIKDPKLVGLYLSTSALSAEATDYLGQLESTGYEPQVMTGDSLLVKISKELSLPRSESVSALISTFGVSPLSLHYLQTEHGTFLVQVSAELTGISPVWFSVIRQDGSVISDRSFLDAIAKNVMELRELTPLGAKALAPASSKRNVVQEGLILGTEWADYRLPASPQFFVGRKIVSQRVRDLVSGSDNPGVIQVKSRSGVGKSSLMASLEVLLRTDLGINVQLYDARNLKSVIDIFAVIQHFTDSSQPITDFGDVENALAALPQDSRSVLMIDQFESTFASSELFLLYESIALAAMKHRSKLTVIVARKNDLITTYDSSHVSLDRLNGLATSIVLDDFTALEAVELIEHIGKAAEKKISSEIKTYVLEFAQGFPWLLKRTMAHIVKFLKSGSFVADLVPAALRLDDLFNEELDELDEVERDYLVRIAARLPATYQELDRAFDEDRNLPLILEKLTYHRLFRLSGTTYDTYNDVFKEYLVYKKLPDYKWSFLYKLGPPSVMKPFVVLSELARFSTEQVVDQLQMARGSAFNLVRELRNLGLIDRDGETWIIPEMVREAYDRNRLGEHVRQQAVRNGLISELLTEIQNDGSFPLSEIPTFLSVRFPFIRATSKTWGQYAKNLQRWIVTLKLVDVRDQSLVSPSSDRAMIAKELGNLRVKLRPHNQSVGFLPGVHWIHIENTFRKLEVGEVVTSVKQRIALRDLQEMEIANADRLRISGVENLKTAIASFLMSPPYDRFWAAVASRENLDSVLVSDFGLGKLSPGTVLWRRKILINWGKSVGIIPNQNVRKSSRRLVSSLFAE
jgi:hypothetical protein